MGMSRRQEKIGESEECREEMKIGIKKRIEKRRVKY